MKTYIVTLRGNDYDPNRWTSEVRADYFVEDKGWIVFFTDPPKVRVAAYKGDEVIMVKLVVDED